MLLPDEWQWLRDITASGADRQEMTGAERALLYETAIQTGLRANELRSLTRGRLYLGEARPFITCKPRSTKNKKPAKQHIRPETAAALKVHVASKAPKARVFNLPSEFDTADLLRGDLADARREWLKAAKHDPLEYQRREQSDFLLDVNHEGEHADFHCLRHTCGAWLAKAGVRPNVVLAVMRHSDIRVTMDTYGHLFPDDEANAVDGLRDFLAGPPEALAATGTDDATAEPSGGAQRQAQRAGRGTRRVRAMGSDATSKPAAQQESPKPLRIANLGDGVRSEATENESTLEATLFVTTLGISSSRNPLRQRAFLSSRIVRPRTPVR